MPDLQTFHGHVVDLRRHVNVHWRHLHPIAPTDRYELWLRAPDGTEHTFTVHTREMPARRGHEVGLITTAHRRPRVLAWPTGRRSTASTTPAASCRVGDAGKALFLPAAAVMLAAMAAARRVA